MLQTVNCKVRSRKKRRAAFLLRTGLRDLSTPLKPTTFGFFYSIPQKIKFIGQQVAKTNYISVNNQNVMDQNGLQYGIFNLRRRLKCLKYLLQSLAHDQDDLHHIERETEVL